MRSEEEGQLELRVETTSRGFEGKTVRRMEWRSGFYPRGAMRGTAVVMRFEFDDGTEGSIVVRAEGVLRVVTGSGQEEPKWDDIVFDPPFRRRE